MKVPSVTNKENLYTFTVFKKSMLKQCELTPQQHANITKVLLNDLDDCIETLACVLKCETVDIPKYTIDNLTATCSLGRKIDMQKFLVKNSSLRKAIAFNPEKFPGCFLTFNNKKAVLFRSGIVNILACKTLEEVEEVYSWISQITAYT